MAHSEAYTHNEAYRNFLQNLCSQALEYSLDGTLASRGNPADADPNWYPNIIRTYNINGQIYFNDWKAEFQRQRQLRGLPLVTPPT